MIAIDTNILVKAHRQDAEDHGPARAALERLAAGRARWALPWQSLHEFFGVVTHPRIFEPPSTSNEAVAQIEAWLEAPSVELIGESRGYWPILREQLQRGRVTGPRVHDARIAAVCLFHGVTELWTADRDFGRFPSLRVRNPLLP
jgi:toxin-antitoxin system PIN domain toxin